MDIILFDNRVDRLTRRVGITLVELLVVMAVIVLLAGLTLPSFKSMLKDQRVTQSARMVQSMAESAQARAIALGRPVALIFERLPVDLSIVPVTPEDLSFMQISDNTCVRLSIGEVFPPYEGDWAGATGQLRDLDSDSFPETMDIEFAKAASLVAIDNLKTPPVFGLTGLAAPGDLIQLSDHSQMFIITTIAPIPNLISPTHIRIVFQNPPTWGESAWSTQADRIRFRLIRRPSKTLTGSTVLPRGMCVDLSESGIGVSGNEFAVNTRSNYPKPDEYGSLFVVFGSRGNVDVVYYRENKGLEVFKNVTPTGVLHFLVGRIDQVQPGGVANPVSARDDFKLNLFDTANVWVSINPFNGAIYSTTNAAIDTTIISTKKPREQARDLAIKMLSGRGI